ncbi:MAG: EF-P beta-lysylation protein EpmB [Pirellulales bacterium]|nr:EF-P beta-lysylation protein EpmB [Pirellulales bacterium]
MSRKSAVPTQHDLTGGGLGNDPAWRQELRCAIRDPYELCRRLRLPEAVADESAAAVDGFPLFVTESYVSAMRPGDVDDPLLRQVLPRRQEKDPTPGFIQDPLAESTVQLRSGLLQKYHGRALLIVTGACAVHCRYCFRRHYPYAESPKTITDWEPALQRLASDASIHEVILSGGDPLTVVDGRLAQLATQLAAIPHLERLRIHSRLPIVLPSRVCKEFLTWFCSNRLKPVMVIHANHSHELTGEVAVALESLSQRGVMLLNQAVLLAGVNDTFDTQRELCERLVMLGVTPYYLHLLDPVAGSAHFDVSEAKGKAIIDELRTMLPGYAVPRLVREEPQSPSKTVIR